MISRRELLIGALIGLALYVMPIGYALAQTVWYQRGKLFFPHSPIQFVTQGFSSIPKLECLNQHVPNGAEVFYLHSPLFRGVSDQFGNTDVAGLARLPGYEGTAANNYDDGADFGKFGQAALSGANPSVPAGTLVESLGNTLAIPNVHVGKDWACFYWIMRGNTVSVMDPFNPSLPGPQITLQLVGYKMP